MALFGVPEWLRRQQLFEPAQGVRPHRGPQFDPGLRTPTVGGAAAPWWEAPAYRGRGVSRGYGPGPRVPISGRRGPGLGWGGFPSAAFGFGDVPEWGYYEQALGGGEPAYPIGVTGGSQVPTPGALTPAGTHAVPEFAPGGVLTQAGTHLAPGAAGMYGGRRTGASAAAWAAQQAGGGGPGVGGGAGAGAAGGGGGVKGGPTFRNPPDNVDKVWYQAFQREHQGLTPEEFYTGREYDDLFSEGERNQGYPAANAGIREALEDRRWAEGFQDYSGGKTPTEDDWKAHWHASRPGQQRPWYEGMNPARVARIGEQRRKWRMQARREAEGDTQKQRPPNWVPPVTYWRYTQ